MKQLNFNDSYRESSKKNRRCTSLLLLFLMLTLTGQNLFAQNDDDPPLNYCGVGFAWGCALGAIDSFTILGSGLNHQQLGCSTYYGDQGGGYSDYTDDDSLQIDLHRGQTYQFTMTGGGINEWAKLWIDFNENGSFDEGGDMLFWSTQANGTEGILKGSFTIPLTAPLSTTRMRVIRTPAELPFAPCGMIGIFGEVNDYMVNILPAPDCYMPTLVLTSNISDVAADLSWTSNGESFDIEWGELGFEQGSGVLENGITTTTYSLTGLTASTTYQYYIRQNCGDDGYSTWAGPYIFKTLCTPVDDFFEDFESYSSGGFVDCWDKISVVGSNPLILTYEDNKEMQQANSNESSSSIVILQPVTNINSGTHWLRFKARTSSTLGMNYLQVGYITDVSNGNSFIEVMTVNLTNTYSEYMTIFPTSIPSNSRIAIRNAIQNSSNYWDDVYWEEAPACIPPLNITANNFTQTTADLKWLGDGTSFEIEYGEPNFVLGTGVLVNELVGSPYTLTGLESFTEYDYYVRQDCLDTEDSNWSGPFTFRTLCNEVDTIIEDFDDLTTEYSILSPDCWDRIVSGLGTLVVTTTGPPAASGSYRVRQYSNSQFDATIAVLPPVNNINSGTHWFKFKAVTWLESQVGHLQVGYITDISNPSSFVEVMSINVGYSEFQSEDAEYIIPFTSDIPANARIAVRNPGTSSVEIYWDNVRWEPATDCIFPINLKTTNISDQSTVLSWVSDGTTFDVEYGLEGFILGEGTTISEVGNPYTITSLSSDTSYDYYVRRDCGDGDYSIWTGPFTFKPGSYLGTIPTSLHQNPTVNDDACGNLFSVEVPEGQQIASLNVKYSILSTSSAWTSQQRSALYSPTLGIGEETVSIGDNIDFPGYIEYDRNVTFANGATGVVGFELKAWRTQGGSDCGTDLIYVMAGSWKLTPVFEDIPTCPNPPSDLGYTSITEDSVDLVWIAEEGTFQIKWGTIGFNLQTAGTTVSGITTNSYTLQELDSSIRYEFYVRRDCSTEEGEDFGDWTGPFKFNAGYCIPTSTTAHYFTLFSTTDAVENINFSYPNSDLGTGYKNETDMVVVQNAGESFNFSSNYVGGTSGLRIWIDWNNDFIFEDSEEVYYLGGAGNKTGSITVPEDAINGDYRMRVRTQSGANVTPVACGNISTGEAIDFTLRVQNGTNSTIDFNSFDFGYYPNPVSEMLYLRANTEIKEVVVFNMLGQQLDLPIHSNNTQLNMTGLPSGNYVMIVTIEGVNKTFKIVKIK